MWRFEVAITIKVKIKWFYVRIYMADFPTFGKVQLVHIILHEMTLSSTSSIPGVVQDFML
uniref:Uncharacterized protein n=1 Tax=Brugia timori TaxID=42155 RepID=A0A0R3Q633_9BILA